MTEAPENIDQCELSPRSSFGHQDLALPNSLWALVLKCLRPNINQKDRNTGPLISRQAAQSHIEPTATSKHNP